METRVSAGKGRARLQLERYPQRCIPPIWARGGHAQTLAGHVLPAAARPVTRYPGARRYEVELDDGERLSAYELAPTGPPSGVRVHLFHGLSGDVDSDYMRQAAAVLVSRGHEVVAVNHRGCGDGRTLAMRPYHSGKTDDMRAVLADSRARAAGRAHVVVGFSLSGNMALLSAAQGLDPQPDGLIAVNPPVDLRRATEDMAVGLCRLYQLRFVWRLRRAVREREAAGRTLRHYDIPLRSTMLEFDDAFTAPECGFESGLDYYARCSAGPRLAEVDTPSVVLTAADDPFVAPAMFEVPRSSRIFLHVEETGGHVGYVERRGRGWGRWLDGALAHYVEALAGA